MTRPVILASLLMALAVATSAYDPPSEYWIAAVRDLSNPGELDMNVWITQDESCELDQTDLESEVESEMVRSRIERVPTSLWGAAHLIIWVTCIDTDAGYVYNVASDLAAPFDDDAGYSLLIPTFKGYTGITAELNYIEQLVEEVAEDVLTDFIYAHSQE